MAGMTTRAPANEPACGGSASRRFTVHHDGVTIPVSPSRVLTQACGSISAVVRSASRCAVSKWGVSRVLVMAKEVPVAVSA